MNKYSRRIKEYIAENRELPEEARRACLAYIRRNQPKCEDEVEQTLVGLRFYADAEKRRGEK